MSISVVLNTKNMAATLKMALVSVQVIADEIIVVDMNSQDETVVIAKKFGAKVFPYQKDLGFADPARNFAISKATKDWVLVLDADEEVPPALVRLLKQIAQGKIDTELKANAYRIPRQNVIFQQALEHTGWWPDYQLRFFKKGQVKWSEQVHGQPEAKGKVVTLPADPKIALQHHNYQNVQQFIERLNRYTDLAQVQKSPAELEKLVLTPAEMINAWSSEFFRRFFVGKGYADGLHGLSLSLLQSFYEFSSYLKFWEKRQFADHTNSRKIILAIENFDRDLRYWLADWHVQHDQGLKQLYWRWQRKRHSHR